jgi:Leucine-rich repeat (LRR) protein
MSNKEEIHKRIEAYRLGGGQVLDLSNLSLKRLPKEIERCENLTGLNVSHNKLSKIPGWLGSMRACPKFCVNDRMS